MIENDFSPEIWKAIENTVLKLKQQGVPLIAAFDADGTLWNADLGEAFFKFQIDNKLVPLPPDPWNFYLNLKKKNNDPREAYLWLAQINKGIPFRTLKSWTRASVESASPIPIFVAQKKLIALLQKWDVEIYIITASIKWAVEAGMSLFGLKDENVIGVETIVDSQGIVTHQQKGEITYLEGKVSALLNKTNGHKPFLAVGNTMGDYPLIAASSELHLGVSAATKDHKLYKTEMELLDRCRQNGWMSHNFF